jgi:hypothetical protein
MGSEGGRLMKKTVAILMALACSRAMAAEWKGHLTTLFDAQVSCTDMLSLGCRPSLAEAVAVADVFHQIAKPDEEGETVTFRDMRQEKCSQNWLQYMNGESLLHSTLALPVSSEDAKSLYFTDALMRASRQLCHS